MVDLELLSQPGRSSFGNNDSYHDHFEPVDGVAGQPLFVPFALLFLTSAVFVCLSPRRHRGRNLFFSFLAFLVLGFATSWLSSSFNVSNKNEASSTSAEFLGLPLALYIASSIGLCMCSSPYNRRRNLFLFVALTCIVAAFVWWFSSSSSSFFSTTTTTTPTESSNNSTLHSNNDKPNIQHPRVLTQEERLLQELRYAETLWVTCLRWTWNIARWLLALLAVGLFIVHYMVFRRYRLLNVFLLLCFLAFLYSFHGALSFDQLYYYNELLPPSASSSFSVLHQLSLPQDINPHRFVSAFVRLFFMGLLQLCYWGLFALAGLAFTIYSQNKECVAAVHRHGRNSDIAIFANSVVMYGMWWLVWTVVSYCW